MSLLWARQVEGGPRRVNHAAVCIDDYIYSFGGYCTGENFEIRRDMDVHRFDTVTLKWSMLEYRGEVADIPYQRYGHAAVAYDGCCYIYGGRNDVDGVSEHVYKFDVANREWSRPEVSGEQPLARDGHSCAVIGHTMYLFGGYEEKSMAFSKTVYTLNLITYEWFMPRHTGNAPLWRDFHSASAWKHYMIVFGGRSDEFGPVHTNSEKYDNSIYIYDTINEHWTSPSVTGDIPHGRRSHCAFSYQDKLYIFGGYNGVKGIHYNDIHVYDPEKYRWKLLKPGGLTLPRARRRACSCLVDNCVYIFGGTSPNLEIRRFRRSRLDQENLMELSDLNILDLSPSLKTRSMLVVAKNNIAYEGIIPKELAEDLRAMTTQSVPVRAPNG